jgi:hypothetical protein
MTTTWLTALGLAIEIAGLAFLFFDLSKSKNTGFEIEAFRSFQEQIDRQTQDMIINAYSAVSTLTTAIRHYFVLKEQANRPAPALSAHEQKLIEESPELAEAMKIISPQNLVELTERTFKQAQERLKTRQEIDEGVKKIQLLRIQMDSQFISLVNFSKRLRNIAYVGIALVLFGATLQFVDLVFI